MAATGNTELDKIFSYNPELTLFYGEPATGKTTLCLLAAKEEKGKVIFIDTENSFSAERMMQINGSIPDNIAIIRAKSFKEQCKAIERLLLIKKNIKMIIVDSHTVHYRKELQAMHDVNPKMSKMLSILSELARENIPVILTSQVYTTQEGKIEPVGSNMIKRWCPCILRLEKNIKERKLIFEKHGRNQGIEIKFEITNEGILLL